MKEEYELENTNLPCPHDSLIKEIRFVNNAIEFIFEKDIANHDSVSYNHPNAKSLIITYELEDKSEDSIFIFAKHYNRFLKKDVYKVVDANKFKKYPETELTYLDAYEGYESLVIEFRFKHRKIVAKLIGVKKITYNRIE